MAGFTSTLAALSAAGAMLAWLAAVWFAFGIWRHRGDVSRLELAGSFLTAVRKLPPQAALARFFAAFAAFFAFALVGMIAGLIASR